MADFSGYIAADELYDGPLCILSIVDNRKHKRIIYEVLDHAPTHQDIRRFFGRFKKILKARQLTLRGITTDASPLYPVPIAEVFGDLPQVPSHQICQFHTIAEVNKAVLRALAKTRKALDAKVPKLPRGRPTRQMKKTARLRQRKLQRIADLFEHRYLFVRHELTKAQKKTLLSITRGLPQLRALREIVTEVYRLFDRRCRSETALAKLSKLRQRVRRFKSVGRALQKLFSPNLEKALVFLDDSLLPSTSNAVERGNRRHRKMQKSVYRVRSLTHISHRIALDMQRDARMPGRILATVTLHAARAAQMTCNDAIVSKNLSRMAAESLAVLVQRNRKRHGSGPKKKLNHVAADLIRGDWNSHNQQEHHHQQTRHHQRMQKAKLAMDRQRQSVSN